MSSDSTQFSYILILSFQISSTTRKSQHVPCGACYYVISSDPNFHEEPHLFRGPGCLEEFLDSITATSLRLKDSVVNGKPLVMSATDQAAFDAASDCYLCNTPFAPNDKRHRDHNHITGDYREAAHARCNINHR